MIPGEIDTDRAGEIELNAGPRRRSRVDGGQHRRPADPGRLALPLLRDQRGARVRPRRGARLPARTSPPAPRCASSRARTRTVELVALRRRAQGLRLSAARCMGKLEMTPTIDRRAGLRRDVRPDRRATACAWPTPSC